MPRITQLTNTSHHPLHLFVLGDVELHPGNPLPLGHALRFDFPDGVIDAIPAAGEDEDIGTPCCQQLGRREADSARSTRDVHVSILESLHSALLSSAGRVEDRDFELGVCSVSEYGCHAEPLWGPRRANLTTAASLI